MLSSGLLFSERFSSLSLSWLSPAAQGSAYLLTHRSWTSRIGTGFKKWSFSRPRRLVTTRPASWSCFRCFITPNRVIAKRPSRALNVWPSSRNSSSRRPLLVGSARALNTASIASSIGDRLVTCQAIPIISAEALSSDPMVKIGVVFPSLFDDPGDYLADARALETAGVDAVWIPAAGSGDLLLAAIA